MASTVWKGQLTFGLVSIPVRLFRAARRERVALREVAPTPETVEGSEEWLRPASKPVPALKLVPKAPEPPEEDEPEPAASIQPVSQKLVTAEGAPVARKDLLKAHQVAPDRFVTFTQQELKALRPATSTEMQIVRSVRLAEIDPVYFETSYYVAPDKGGERALSMLHAALKETGFVALAGVAMHGREHTVVIRPGLNGLLAHTLFQMDEIRAVNQYELNAEQVGPKELALAKTFVEAIAGPFAPEEFHDVYKERLEALIAGKLARNEVSGTEAQPEAEVAETDLLQKLKESLKKAQQSARKEELPGRRGPAKVSRSEKVPRKTGKSSVGN